jgi:hypothetical protein
MKTFVSTLLLFIVGVHNSHAQAIQSRDETAPKDLSYLHEGGMYLIECTPHGEETNLDIYRHEDLSEGNGPSSSSWGTLKILVDPIDDYAIFEMIDANDETAAQAYSDRLRLDRGLVIGWKETPEYEPSDTFKFIGPQYDTWSYLPAKNVALIDMLGMYFMFDGCESQSAEEYVASQGVKGVELPSLKDAAKDFIEQSN